MVGALVTLKADLARCFLSSNIVGPTIFCPFVLRYPSTFHLLDTQSFEPVAAFAQQFAHATHMGCANEGDGISLSQIFKHALAEDPVTLVNDGVMAAGKAQAFCVYRPRITGQIA